MSRLGLLDRLRSLPLTRSTSTWPSVLRFGNYGIVLPFGALVVALSLGTNVFLTPTNVLNILDQNAALLIVACAGTMVIIAGGFDLSVGAIFGVAGAAAAGVALAGSVELGWLTGILLGGVLGVGNGILVTVGKINTFIATLASSIVIYGFGQVVTGGYLITVPPGHFADLGNQGMLGVKFTVWILAAVVITTSILLSWSVFGRYVYAVGGNAEASRFSGVRVGLIRTCTYGLSGLAAGIAGVLVASRISQGQSQSGIELPLTAITAIVIGGTSILGGEGVIWRTVLGGMVLALIGNGFNLLNVDPSYQRMVQGIIIVAAVAGDAWTRQRRT